MEVASGILTSRGGMTSHAAVVTRGMGKCCVAGAGDIEVSEEEPRNESRRQDPQGRRLDFLDGTTGRVIKGQLKTVAASPDDPELLKFMSWAEPFRRIGVRANADIPRDALQARAFGAEGIGLCRTEHMFFAEDRLPHMRTMILANNEKDRRAGAEKTSAHAARRFRRPLPRHGRLPGHHPHSRSAAARVPAASRRPHGRDRETRNHQAPLAQAEGTSHSANRVEQLHEVNPMLGLRGCRLGITYPEITEMQARAIFEAAVKVAKA